MKSPKVGFVSLGCPKALVDSERILTQLKTEGYDVASDYDGADLVVVNTCGFIESAVQESLDAIGEAMEPPLITSESMTYHTSPTPCPFTSPGA